MTPNTPPSEPTGKPCVICKAPAVKAHRPFCSDRCRQVDLSRWLGGVYTFSEDTDDMVSSDFQELANEPANDKS